MFQLRISPLSLGALLKCNVFYITVYLNRSDINIIVVDWSNISLLPFVQSRLQIGRVAKEVAVFLTHLMDKLGLPPENIHIWGYSLGCHVAGLSAKKLRGPKIATIIGKSKSYTVLINNIMFAEGKVHVFAALMCYRVAGRGSVAGTRKTLSFTPHRHPVAQNSRVF